jgi:predicted Fe-Mo cluster-binding NifX family protein
MLTELGVEAVICGGIDRFCERRLSFLGLQVYAWVTGEVEEALRLFLEGRLESGQIMDSGGGCCGRWRFRKGGKPPGERLRQRARDSR